MRRHAATIGAMVAAGILGGGVALAADGRQPAGENVAAGKAVSIEVKKVVNDNPSNRNMEHATLDATLQGATLADLMSALDEALGGVNAVYDVPAQGKSVKLPDMALRGVSGRLLLSVVLDRVNTRMEQEDADWRVEMDQNQNVYRFYLRDRRPKQPPQTVNQPQLMGPNATDFIAVGPLLEALSLDHGKEGVAVLMSALEEGLKPMPYEAQAAELKLHGPSSLLIVRGTSRQTQNAQTIVRRLSEQAVARRTQAAIGPEALTKLRADLERLSEHGRMMQMELQGQKDEGRRLRMQGDIDEINWQIESVRRQIETIQMLRLMRPLVLPGVDSNNPIAAPFQQPPQPDPMMVNPAPVRPAGNRPAK